MIHPEIFPQLETIRTKVRTRVHSNHVSNRINRHQKTWFDFSPLRSLRLLSTSRTSEPSVSSSSSSDPSWSGRGQCLVCVLPPSLLLLLCACRAQSIHPCFSRFRDAIPACSNDEFLKEASEVPNFLEEVDQCRRVYSAASSGEFSSAGWSGTSLSLRPSVMRNRCCLFVSWSRKRKESPPGGVSGNWISSAHEDQERERNFGPHQVQNHKHTNSCFRAL